jgi:multidrug efflux system outer membrane protein
VYPPAAVAPAAAILAGLIVTAYELDFFGRVASLKEQALAQYLATTEAKQTAQLSLISTVAQSWLGLLADEAMLAEARQTLASREESLRLVALKLRHGAASELDLRLAQTLTEAARVTLAQQTQKRALDENAMVLLLGQPCRLRPGPYCLDPTRRHPDLPNFRQGCRRTC